MSDWNDRLAPGLMDFFEIAEQSFARLPAAVRAAAGHVTLHVEDFASEETLNSLGIEDPFELSGLYDGVNIIDHTAFDPMPVVSRVLLYRRPILDEWSERGNVSLGELISHVLVHEIGHHMGFSDADIDALLDGAD
jgi:predicted Zn-dependent protease with MMP-like domain